MVVFNRSRVYMLLVYTYSNISLPSGKLLLPSRKLLVQARNYRRIEILYLYILIHVRAVYTERVNNSRNIVEIVAGDIVIARTTVPSDAFKNKVAKWSYQVQGSFWIVQCTRRGSYLVIKLYKPNSLELKCTTTDLYPPPRCSSSRLDTFGLFVTK